jgi:phospholipid N-methyltransferase
MPKKFFTFFAQVIKNPMKIGAIVPTLRWVARRVIGHIPQETKKIVEYGPGMGAVTFPLLNALSKDCDLFVIERNATFAKKLKTVSLPNFHVIEGDAVECARFVCVPDVILSALPFRAFSEKQRDNILAATAKNLPPHGIFIVYLQYTPFLDTHLKKYFGTVSREFEWRNLPPTYLYVCRKPITPKNP